MNDYTVAINGMHSILLEVDKPLETFKKKFYAENFQLFYEKYVPVMDSVERLYTSVMEPDTFIGTMSQALVETAKEKVDSFQKKNQKEGALMDLNMCMAIYVFPIILKYRGTSSQPLVDHILKDWKEAFPKTNLQAAEFEYIEKGFHRKFCYITTAVCETFQKPDDCYELTLLRDYRDGYLAESADGDAVIRAYYDVAPSIVKHINQQDNAKEIYQNIWSEYISPCISMIEQGENENCKELYMKMVQDLQNQYFILQ